MRRLLTDTKSTLATVLSQHKDYFSTEPPRLIVVSALAEGADRIVAEVGRDLGLELFCPLPFARDEYAKDFDDAASRSLFQRLLAEASVFELDGSRTEADLAYESAGLFVLRQSDVVIAVWNGEPGAGRGGTHDIVQSAIAAGIPTIRFDEHGVGPSLLLPVDGNASPNARDLIGETGDAGPHRLEALVRTLVEPPPQNESQARQRLDDYYGETERPTNNWLAYPLMLRVLASRRGVWRARRPAPYLASTDTAWQKEFWLPMAGACTIDPRVPNKAFAPANIAEALQPRFAWADGLAIFYGQAYRSSYVLAFILGAVAVFFAVVPLPISLLFAWWFGDNVAEASKHHIEFVASLLALLSIAIVSYLVWQGQQARRHDKWLDYRLLAERLRVIRVLSLTGSPMPELRMPHRDESLKSQQSWVTWYVRATLREIGIPQGRGDTAYAEMVKCALLEAELRGQAAFHKSYSARERDIGERLEWLGVRLFAVSAFATVLALGCFAYIIIVHPAPDGGAFFGRIVADLTMFVVALLPATGAALFSVRSHGEFERNARLSEATSERLASIIRRVEASAATTFASVSRATDDTAVVLTGELSDWRFIFWGKPLTLPG